jgi:hypothetical protein
VNLADGTPLWPSELTAWGTLAVAVAAVLVALFGEWRTSKRLAQQQIRHEAEITEEHRLADQRLAEQEKAAEERLRTQMVHSDEQLRQEREAAETRLKEERDLALKREQYEEAVAIHVTEARITPEGWGSRVISSDPTQPIECPAAIVLNRSRYTITRLQAQLRVNESLTSYGKRELFSSLGKLPEEITTGLAGEGRDIWGDTLRPTDIGMRFSSDAMTVQNLHGSYPIVRWRDRWGSWWEHRHGEVRQIEEGEEWRP